MEIQIRNENRPAKIKEQQQQLEYQKYAESSINQDVIENVNTLHHHFIHRLATKYPSLTRDDILFCSLLLLGSETAEIAAILQIKPESINKRRFRLRKKMGLAHDDSLVDFLAKFWRIFLPFFSFFGCPYWNILNMSIIYCLLDRYNLVFFHVSISGF